MRHEWSRWASVFLMVAAMLLPETRAQGVYHNQRLFVVPAPG